MARATFTSRASRLIQLLSRARSGRRILTAICSPSTWSEARWTVPLPPPEGRLDLVAPRQHGPRLELSGAPTLPRPSCLSAEPAEIVTDRADSSSVAWRALSESSESCSVTPRSLNRPRPLYIMAFSGPVRPVSYVHRSPRDHPDRSLRAAALTATEPGWARSSWWATAPRWRACGRRASCAPWPS